MDLCRSMRVESINGKRYILVIVDDYSRYTWVHFLRSKDKAPEEIKTFLKNIQVLLQALVIIVFEALYYPKNDREDIGKLGAKGDTGFFIVILLIHVLTDSGLDLTYDPSIISSQKPTKHELNFMYEAMYADYISSQLSTAQRTTPAAPTHQVLQTSTASTVTTMT
ncbi:retrovirus-related pol polyprotein from transposon TNT 1-94 [Tanacetum coccineum]